MRFLLVACLVLLPVAARAATPELTVEKPWMRYLLPSIPAAGYMELQNPGAADVVITGAASPACGMLMLHKSTDTSGMAMMMDVPSITVPAHGSVTLAPGGYHLMCMQPAMKLGDNVPVTLSLQDGSTVSASLPVYGAQSSP
ncbi:MAG: copper chaperone PCu(A)C [Acidocella sp.]|nr:copper chaperone PCu(A)C [Acidocella sp.]